MFRPAIIFLRLCHGTVLTALRGVHRFTSAQATIFIATKQPVSTRAKDSMYPRLARLILCAAKPHKGSAPRDIASAPRPLHAALPCGGGRPQSSLTLTPPAVKGAYFSLLTVNLNRAIFSACCGNKTAKYSDSAMPKSPGLGEKRGWPFPGTGTGQEGAALG